MLRDDAWLPLLSQSALHLIMAIIAGRNYDSAQVPGGVGGRLRRDHRELLLFYIIIPASDVRGIGRI